jgi:hypothetical protein
MPSDQQNDDYPVDISSQKDANRLQQIHHVVKQAMKNRLVFAPVEFAGPKLKILDSCTSDGFWLLDLRSDVDPKYEHSFLGTDIDDSRFPPNLPQDVNLQVQDANGPWPPAWKNSFDLVHQRFGLLATGPNPHKVASLLLDLVKPGGWVQFVEAEYTPAEGDPPSHHQFMNLMKELFARIGQGADVIRQVSGWLKDAGFVDVKEETIPMYLGAKVPDPNLRGQSVHSTAVAIEGMVTHVKSKSDTNAFIISDSNNCRIVCGWARMYDSRRAKLPRC